MARVDSRCCARHGPRNRRRPVPSLDHEAPLVLLREEPTLAATVLRDLLGVELPAFATAELTDAGFTQVVPAELRADLVVELRGGPPDRAPVMGIIVERQRARDDDKEYAWPLYLAALRARLRCPACLVVVATDDAVARWAARPMAFQPGAPFVPLVLGPDRVPRLAPEQAVQEPWLALLAALVHGNRPDGADAVRAACAALSALPASQASLCYDLIYASLNEVARRVLEDEMQTGKYEYQSEFARRYFGEGREQGREQGRVEGAEVGRQEGARAMVLALAERHGPLADDLRLRIAGCTDLDVLRALALDLARASDAAAVAALLARL